MTDRHSSARLDSGIASMPMAGRFAGARSVGGVWRNLRAGVESNDRDSDGGLGAARVPA